MPPGPQQKSHDFAGAAALRGSGSTRPPHSISEFVAQGELHYARLGQQAGVGAEAAGRLGQRSEQGCSYTLGVETVEVRDVENFPSKLQIVRFPIGHFPAFREAHVPTGEAVATQDVARANPARERQGESVLGGGGVGKRTNKGIGLPCHGIRDREMVNAGPLGGPSEEPVGGPAMAAVHTVGKSAGPASKSEKLPTTNESV